MNEFGEVVELKDNIALVKFKRSSACGSCTSCGMSANQQEIIVDVINTKDAKVGELVNIEIDSKKALISSAVAYVFPLIMLIIGVGLGYILASNGIITDNADMLGAILGITFTAASFLGIKSFEKFFKRKMNTTYKMI